MTTDFAPSAPPSGDFADQLRRVAAGARRDGLRLDDMRLAPAIELTGGLSAVDPEAAGALAGSAPIERLEGAIAGRRVPRAASPSRLCAFLDGTQRTLPMFRAGHTPIYVTLSAAAIARRDEAGQVDLHPGSLRLAHAWIVPEAGGDPNVAAIAALLREGGADVVDPLLTVQPEQRASAGADYGFLEQQALQVARRRREAIERDLLLAWAAASDPADWIVVDGALRAPVDRAIGLVKSFTYQYVVGDEALALFTLPEAARTTAFRAANRWRNAAAGDPRDDASLERTLWYLRFRDAAGQDARYGLVRLEAHRDIDDTDTLDLLSAWVLAERRPSPTADARQDSLIYPIHLLERMLKTRLDAVTRAWPGSRQRA